MHGFFGQKGRWTGPLSGQGWPLAAWATRRASLPAGRPVAPARARARWAAALRRAPSKSQSTSESSAKAKAPNASAPNASARNSEFRIPRLPEFSTQNPVVQPSRCTASAAGCRGGVARRRIEPKNSLHCSWTPVPMTHGHPDGSGRQRRGGGGGGGEGEGG
jgi:hypothetical protein